VNEKSADVVIRPAPTDEELAAIVAVLEVLQEEQAGSQPKTPPRSTWAEAARREALRGNDSDT
jgi:hypothetical protein